MKVLKERRKVLNNFLRSEEHTSELQSPCNLVCRLLLESRHLLYRHSFPTRRSSDLLTAYVDNKLLLQKLTNDKLQTELKFLKAQYHPHFLFNALNTVYFQMDESVEGAKKSIEQFS